MTTQEFLAQAKTLVTRDKLRAAAADSNVVVKDNDNVSLYSCSFTLKPAEQSKPLEDLEVIHFKPALLSIIRNLESRNMDGEFGEPFILVDKEDEDGLVLTLYVPVRELQAPVSAL